MRTEMRRKTGLGVAVAGLALALSACAGGSDSPRGADGGGHRTRPSATAPAGTLPGEPPGSTPTSPPAGTATVVPAAVEFSAPALGGGRVVGADYADTGVALWFWAPW